MLKLIDWQEIKTDEKMELRELAEKICEESLSMDDIKIQFDLLKDDYDEQAGKKISQYLFDYYMFWDISNINFFNVCEDCIQYCANSELNPNDTDEQIEKFVKNFEATQEKYGQLMLGDCEESYFSPCDCEVCGALPGDRYENGLCCFEKDE